MNSDCILKGTSGQITKNLENIVFVDDTLYEHMEIIKKQFKELMIQKGTRKIEIRNGDNAPYRNSVRAFVTQGEFEIANYIMYHTILPRLAIFKIIKGIEKRKLLNNQDILDTVTQMILKN